MYTVPRPVTVWTRYLPASRVSDHSVLCINCTIPRNKAQVTLSLYTNIPLSPKSCFEMPSLYCNCVVFCVSRYPVLYFIVFVFVYMLMGHHGFMH